MLRKKPMKKNYLKVRKCPFEIFIRKTHIRPSHKFLNEDNWSFSISLVCSLSLASITRHFSSRENLSIWSFSLVLEGGFFPYFWWSCLLSEFNFSFSLSSEVFLDRKTFASFSITSNFLDRSSSCDPDRFSLPLPEP